MFDPYHKWLGIPPGRRPPTHYQLLGIAPAEEDPEVIEEAALGRTAHLRTYQAGPHALECAKLLNEIARAKLVLRDAPKRREYDARLAQEKAEEKEDLAQAQFAPDQAHLAWDSSTESPPSDATPPEFPNSQRSHPRAKGPAPVVYVVVSVAVAALVVLGVVLLSHGGKGAADKRADASATTRPSSINPPPASPPRSAKGTKSSSSLTLDTQPAEAPHVVAVWTHRPGGGAGSEISLYSNGRINQPDGPNTWSLTGDTLVLTWPNRSAPGGQWIDRCVLSKDRKSFQGKNQNGAPISGQLVRGGL